MTHATILRDAAEALARRAHAGQLDKAGRPYIEHVERVAAACADHPIAEIVAWLHDVEEDCPQFVRELDAFPESVSWPVFYLTRRPGITPEHYYERIRRDPIALRVKLADIADNADEARLSLLDPDTADRLRKKYAVARAHLSHQE